MEATIRRLKFLEEQSLVWRKQYDEEERRIEEDYQRNLAEINAEFRKAAQKIKLEYASKRAEVIKQHSDKSAGKNATGDPSPVTVPCISESVCTSSQCIEVKAEQPTKSQTNSLIQKPLIAAAATAHVSGEADLDRDNSDGNNENARVGVRQICVHRMQIVCRLAKQKGQVRVYVHCGCCDATTTNGTIGEIFGVFDPGGSAAGFD